MCSQSPWHRTRTECLEPGGQRAPWSTPTEAAHSRGRGGSGDLRAQRGERPPDRRRGRRAWPAPLWVKPPQADSPPLQPAGRLPDPQADTRVTGPLLLQGALPRAASKRARRRTLLSSLWVWPGTAQPRALQTHPCPSMPWGRHC